MDSLSVEVFCSSQFPFAKKIQTYAISREKLLKMLLYEKAARKMLVKLTSAERMKWGL